jgi:hypothetical protein
MNASNTFQLFNMLNWILAFAFISCLIGGVAVWRSTRAARSAEKAIKLAEEINIRLQAKT